MESEPLLPLNDSNNGERESTQERVATTLESTRLHQTILILITIDAICVLVDLSYSFLHNSCEGPEENPDWLEIFSIISLVITSLFLIEIPLASYAFGLQYYNPFGSRPHSSLHLFDAFVILVTFILEVVLRGKERELAGLLIILRLWRLIKLVGGVAVGAGELNEETDKQLALAQKEIVALKIQIETLTQENAELQALMN